MTAAGRAHFWASCTVVLVAVAAFAVFEPSVAQSSPSSPSHKLTSARLREPGWWPTRTDANRQDYVGAAACAGCHREQAARQQQTSMARAASRAPQAEVLRSDKAISMEMPPFLTSILRNRNGSTYTVARGGAAISGQVLWAIGEGMMGQTFLVQSGGELFESQLSYFTEIKGLDLTPGHSRATPQDLEHAFGDRQSDQAAQTCFGCHTTASSTRKHLDESRAIPGVSCEACHGPGARHVKAMASGDIEEGRAAILNPASFDAVKQVDFCGACHRTPMDVIAAKTFLPIDIRFQPYRLAKSRCWKRPDVRLSCIACHNPHEEVVRETGFYDSKCLSCHQSGLKASGAATAASSPAPKAPACPVATTRCTSCHMPKYKSQPMHGSFTDHDIRIVRPGEPFPL